MFGASVEGELSIALSFVQALHLLQREFPTADGARPTPKSFFFNPHQLRFQVECSNFNHCTADLEGSLLRFLMDDRDTAKVGQAPAERRFSSYLDCRRYGGRGHIRFR
jgi:hypothetical protein